MNLELSLNPNKLVAALGKPSKEFTKADIVKYIRENGVRMVNFMYPAGDGRLKTLNFVINNEAYLDAILTCGERVDGSSLFPFIEAGSSDLYVLPRFSTAFLDPFAEIPTIAMLCSYFNKDGELLESSPENTLRKACKAFNEVTGMEFQAMGELEYYVIAPDTGMFPATDQKGYHESAPYATHAYKLLKCKSAVKRFSARSLMLSALVKHRHNNTDSTCLAAYSTNDSFKILKMLIGTHRHGNTVHIICYAVIKYVTNDIYVVSTKRLLDSSLSFTAAESGTGGIYQE